MARGPDSIWEVLRQASETLPEPFSASALVQWVGRRRPDVEEASIRTHIHYALVDTVNRTGPWASRTPFPQRVGRGEYRRYRPSEPAPSELHRPAPLVMPSGARVVLVGCSSTKAATAAPAAELFEGATFRKARDFAVRSGAPWFVLSAKYGLLDPVETVAPYDVYLADQPAPYRTAWGEWVVAQLGVRQALAGTIVEIHAGEAYVAPLRQPLRRSGASVEEPLSGLRQGERLAWPGYAQTDDESSVLDSLLDPASAVAPDVFLARGSHGLTAPGLYAWWVDEAGAGDLTRGLGHVVRPGLVYVGKGGGHRQAAAPSAATIWSRISRNHLRGTIGSSTLRRSLAAALGAAGGPVDEADLSRWMHAHLRVAARTVPSADVVRLEEALLRRVQPPLNLAGMPRDVARSTLTRLRAALARRGA